MLQGHGIISVSIAQQEYGADSHPGCCSPHALDCATVGVIPTTWLGGISPRWENALLSPFVASHDGGNT